MRKLWKWWSSNKILSKDIVYKNLFFLARMGLLFLIRLEDILIENKDKIYCLFGKDLFLDYEKSNYYNSGFFFNFRFKINLN